MRSLLGIVIALWFLIVLASAVQAASLYLKDGGIVECESIRRQGDQVIVKVNRDVVVEFGSDEVDLKKTMRGMRHRSGRHLQHKTTSVRNGSTAETAAQKAGEPAGKSAAGGQGGTKGEPQPAVAPPGKESSTVQAQAVPAPPRPSAPTPAPVVPEAHRPVPVISPAAVPPPAMSSTMMSLFVGGTLAFVLLMIASQWKLFEKAGVAGWKSLIPVYNLYILMIVAGKPGWWLILMLIPLVSVVVYLLAMLSLAGRFGKGPAYGAGLFLLPFIFFPLLAFDGSEYRGLLITVDCRS